MKLPSSLLVLFSLPLLSTSAISSATWDEGSLGDFNAGQLFTLTEGDNWFIGTQGWEDDPFDGFRFIVPDGYRATIDVAYQYLNLGESEGAAYVWELYTLAVDEACTPVISEYECLYFEGGVHITSEIFQTPLDYIIPGEWEFAPIDGYVLEAGAYQLADNFRFTDNPNVILSYTFNLNTVHVPVPANTWLLCSGLFVLGGMLSRKERCSNGKDRSG